ncbi:MAG: hypothetical protein HDR89_00435 [Bacteroides sp.]|nr:hypothetical protein [Bacteroides sp.]
MTLSKAIEQTNYYNLKASKGVVHQINKIFSKSVIPDKSADKIFAGDTVVLISQVDLIENTNIILISGQEYEYKIETSWNSQRGFNRSNQKLKLHISHGSLLKKKLEYEPFPGELDYMSLLYFYLESWRMPIPEYIVAGLKRPRFDYDFEITAFRIIRESDGKFTTEKYNVYTFPKIRESVKMTISEKEELIEFFKKLYSPEPIPSYMLNLIKSQTVDSIMNVDGTIYRYNQIENEAEYCGGQIYFLRDFSNALDLSSVNESDYRSKIAAEFIITEDGALIDPIILGDDLHTVKPIEDYTPFDYVVTHALLKLNNGKWKAATKNGNPVSSYYKIVTQIDYNRN